MPRRETRPASIAIDSAMATDIFVRAETAHVATYKLWLLRAGDQWYPIGPETTADDRADHWIFVPPMPDQSALSYWLGVYGHANTAWRVRITLAQRDPSDGGAPWIERASWIEHGTTRDDGHGAGSDATAEIHRIALVVA